MIQCENNRIPEKTAGLLKRKGQSLAANYSWFVFKDAENGNGGQVCY